MTIYIRVKKLPIPLGLLAVFLGFAGGIVLLKNLKSLSSKASTETFPRQTKITNVGSSSFVVSWITEEKATGLVNFGVTTSLGEIRKDRRDQSRSTSEKYLTHYVLIDNLKEETKYYFKIVSSGINYDNSGKLFEVTTSSAKTPPEADIAQGKILTSGKEPASGAIVYLSMANTVTQSALVDDEGNWMIPLSTARNINQENFSNYDRSAQTEEIFVQGERETSSVTLTTGNDNPAPDITLGLNYDFLNQPPPALATSTPIKQSFPESSFNTLSEIELTISFPSEKEEVGNPQPEFLGTGPRGQVLDIVVESSEEITALATTDQRGKWNWSPKQPLFPGQHQITVSYTDENGFLKRVTRTFTVLAAGTSDLPSFTATPSGQRATPSPTPSPFLASPSPTRTPLSTITPTSSPEEAEYTPTPTKTSRTSVPSTESGVLKPGTTLPTNLLFGAGFLAVLVGLALVVF